MMDDGVNRVRIVGKLDVQRNDPYSRRATTKRTTAKRS